MRKNKIMMAVGVLAAITVGITGCSVPSADTGTSSGGSDSKLLGIVSITANEAGNALAIKGATEAAEAAGWTVEVVDAQGNADTANAAFRNFTNKKAGMIFNLVFPATSLAAGLTAARNAGIPVASWGGGTGDGIAMNTGDGGPFAKIVAESLVKDMDGKGEVLALTFHGGQVCIDREAAFDAVLAKNPGIKVTKQEVTIPGFLQDGSKYATSWLASRPAGSANLAVWGCWDDPTLGALSGIKQLNRTDVLTYGTAGSITAIQAIKDGSMTATAYEDGKAEGKAMFETTLEAIEAGSSWTPKTVNVEGVLVNKATIDKFLTDNPGILG